MAEVVFTDEERTRISEVLQDLRPTMDEFFADLRAALPRDDWALLLHYATACMRRVLEVGTSLHAVASAHGESSAPYAGRGRDVFVRDALGAWRDAYAPIPDVWRLALVFDRVPGAESHILTDVATLETMAANRLFTSLDEQCARLSETEA